jgi:hypothetical protein
MFDLESRRHQLCGWYKTVARKNRESFLISIGSDLGFWRQEIGYKVRSILGVIEEDGVMVRLQVISKQSLCRGQTLNSNLRCTAAVLENRTLCCI